MQRNIDYAMGDVHLKPMLSAQASPYSHASWTNGKPYKPIASEAPLSDEYTLSQAADQRLKHRIRVLKLISRVIALLLSLATLAPITMTLVKFLLTRNTTFVVDGQERTAWAAESITWYTYMYFGVSLISCVFNLAIVIAYCRGIKKANNVASVAGWWSNTVLGCHVLVWIVSVALYRYGKEPVAGKFRDLWGWTCSPAAQRIQKDIPNVDFDKYCDVQTASFYTGLVNVAAGILSALIILLAGWRSRSKKRVEKSSLNYQASLEPLRA